MEASNGQFGVLTAALTRSLSRTIAAQFLATFPQCFKSCTMGLGSQLWPVLYSVR